MKKVAIIGAGISGLFIANLFSKDPDYQVTIFEKNNSISNEDGYGIQLSVNSIKILNEIGFDKLDEKEKFNPTKIDFYSNKSLNKICELKISDFNFENCKYTTLKRSVLINFLKKNLEKSIKTNHSISKIDEQSNSIQIYFENNKTFYCDHLIISDGVFSKSKNLISNNKNKAKYNDTLAIRGIISQVPDSFNNKNISLFLGSDFHYVIYPVNANGDLNFIAIMKYPLSEQEQKNHSLFSDNLYFIIAMKFKSPLEFTG